jgi:hypothetical protein
LELKLELMLAELTTLELTLELLLSTGGKLAGAEELLLAPTRFIASNPPNTSTVIDRVDFMSHFS